MDNLVGHRVQTWCSAHRGACQQLAAAEPISSGADCGDLLSDGSEHVSACRDMFSPATGLQESRCERISDCWLLLIALDLTR